MALLFGFPSTQSKARSQEPTSASGRMSRCDPRSWRPKSHVLVGRSAGAGCAQGETPRGVFLGLMYFHQTSHQLTHHSSNTISKINGCQHALWAIAICKGLDYTSVRVRMRLRTSRNAYIAQHRYVPCVQRYLHMTNPRPL